MLVVLEVETITVVTEQVVINLFVKEPCIEKRQLVRLIVSSVKRLFSSLAAYLTLMCLFIIDMRRK